MKSKEKPISIAEVSEILWNLSVRMERIKPTNVCFGYDPTHMSCKAKISMALKYLNSATKLW
jgi:hypothetical protein